MAVTDLDLAVLLLNSVDLLEDPPDRMADDLGWWRRALARNGFDELAAAQRDADLPDAAGAAGDHPDGLRVRRGRRGAPGPQRRAARRRMRWSRSHPRGSSSSGDLRGRLLFAVASHVAEHGVARLGICASDPCRCAYVDRTRGRTRRYCCTLCNDRAAARAYRRRQGETGS